MVPSQPLVWMERSHPHSSDPRRFRRLDLGAYTQGEATSQNLWSRYDRHFVGITRHIVYN